MGQGQRAARRGARHPHRVGRSCCCRASRATQRDGHGNHQTAGLHHRAGRSRPAGDPTQFPEQIKEGLRPVAAVEGLHRRRARERGLDGAHRQRRVQPVARRLVRQLRPLRPELPAIAEQRPLQLRAGGPNYGYYTRVGSRVASAPAKEQGILRRHRHQLLRACSRRSAGARPKAWPTSSPASTGPFGRAHRDFKFTDPSAARLALAAALQFIREAIAKSAGEDEALFLLRIKERQIRGGDHRVPRARADRHRAAGRRGRADRPVRGVRPAAVDGGADARPDLRGPGPPVQSRTIGGGPGRDHASRPRPAGRRRRQATPASPPSVDGHDGAAAPLHRERRCRRAAQHPPVLPSRRPAGEPLRAR